MKLFNLHTHSLFSDGKEEPEAYVLEAIRQGFAVLGFSEHAPVPMPNNFAIREDQLGNYVERISELKKKHKGQIELYTALELDYIPGITKDFKSYTDQCELDYSIGSVHLVKNGSGDHLWFIDGPKKETYDEGLKNTFGGDIKRAVGAYYRQINEMITTQNFDILGHFDKIKMHNHMRYFTEDESWYQNLIDESLELIREKGIIVEVNTRGIYKKRSDSVFPGVEVLAKILALKIPVTLSSDAHLSKEISAYFPEARKILIDLGFTEIQCFAAGKWQSVPLSI
jgi:histidinol-phosphatase (PHP family)